MHILDTKCGFLTCHTLIYLLFVSKLLAKHSDTNWHINIPKCNKLKTIAMWLKCFTIGIRGISFLSPITFHQSLHACLAKKIGSKNRIVTKFKKIGSFCIWNFDFEVFVCLCYLWIDLFYQFVIDAHSRMHTPTFSAYNQIVVAIVACSQFFKY